jgi:zinc transport system ATP-binding protein
MEKYELEIKNLNLSIGNNSILENINLKIKKGEIHCLIGPNGGGKSSLIKYLAPIL